MRSKSNAMLPGTLVKNGRSELLPSYPLLCNACDNIIYMEV